MAIKIEYGKWLRIKQNWVKGVVLLLLIFMPIMVYVFRFSGTGFSDNPADWGTFGDYIGGVYSVVLTIVLVYVTHVINKRDNESNECKKAIKEIYCMITQIDTSKINLDLIHQIYRCIDANSLHLRKDIREKMIREMDYYVCVARDPKMLDGGREERFKEVLKIYYNEY